MKLHVSRRHLTREMMWSLEPSFIRRCWSGESLERAFEWVLACDSERLWFCSRVPGVATFDASNAPGSFVEGLWECDVAEFFMMDARGRYQEFNVSPSGAWWSCGFSSYRERVTDNRVPSDVLVEASVQQQGWQAVFSLPLRELLSPLEEVVGIHVSAIVHASTTKYLSSCPIMGVDPDFHDKRCFASVERIEL